MSLNLDYTNIKKVKNSLANNEMIAFVDDVVESPSSFLFIRSVTSKKKTRLIHDD